MGHATEALALTFEPALGHAITQIGVLARECGDKGREIEKLKQEIAALKNKAIKPYKGCKTHSTEFDGAPVVLEYDYQPAEAAGEYFIGCAAQADLIRVWIGGHPFSYEVFEPAQVEAWEAECLDAEGGAL